MDNGHFYHALIKDLAVADEHPGKQGRLEVSPTMQLPDFPEVFAGRDCVCIKDSSLLPTAQVAYQQGRYSKNLSYLLE
ncbi:MAG: hypothetical protein PUP91_27960 [Rhizonema sp. PD37]|nr:hypothetical protein [Rhizonema sp. PD37]